VRDFIADWTMSHVPALTAALTVWQGRFKGMLAASDRPRFADLITFPWGCNHVTNALMNTGSHGLEFLDQNLHRLDKLQFILEHEEYVREMTICYGQGSAGNCGKCSKCLRDKLFCMALKGTAAPMFGDDDLDEADLKKIRKSTGTYAFHLMMTIEHSRRTGQRDIEQLAARMLRREQRSLRSLFCINRGHPYYLAVRNFIRRLKGKRPLGHGRPIARTGLPPGSAPVRPR